MLPKRSLWVLLLLWAVGAHGQVVIDVTVSFNMTNTTVLAVESLFGPSLGSRLVWLFSPSITKNVIDLWGLRFKGSLSWPAPATGAWPGRRRHST